MDNTITLPDTATPEHFSDATEAVDQLEKLYTEATQYLGEAFSKAMLEGAPDGRIRASQRPVLNRSTRGYHMVTFPRQGPMPRR